MGKKRDPEIGHRLELFQTWLAIWPLIRHMAAAIDAQWKEEVRELADPKRWSRVSNIMSAVVASLFDLGWWPGSREGWTDEVGQSWRIDYDSEQSRWDIEAPISQNIQRLLWQRFTDKHFYGQGSDGGVNYLPAKKLLQKLRAKGATQEMGMLSLIARGALWPSDRLHTEGGRWELP